MAETVGARIRRGMALLDQVKPGWEHRIDVGRLDLWSKCDCVLGPELGRFGDGVEHLHMDGPTATAHGFDVDPATAQAFHPAYRDLTRAWQRAIRRRLDTAGPTGDEGVR